MNSRLYAVTTVAVCIFCLSACGDELSAQAKKAAEEVAAEAKKTAVKKIEEAKTETVDQLKQIRAESVGDRKPEAGETKVRGEKDK